MAKTQLFQQMSARGFIVEKLPDGSTAIFDKVTNTVHALNASAAAAFEACHEPVTLSALTAVIEQRLGRAVTEDTALEAVAELERAGLVSASGTTEELRNASRRQLLKAAGVALPVVLSLTAAEQRAFAAQAVSAPTTTTAAPGTPEIVSATSQTNGHGLVDGCGDTVNVVGSNTHFGGTTTVALVQAGTVESVFVTDSTHLAFSFLNATTSGALDFIVTTGTEVVHGTGFLTSEGCF
jgi:hypothetical protein